MTFIDHNRVEQMIVNIVTNAAKHATRFSTQTMGDGNESIVFNSRDEDKNNGSEERSSELLL